MATPAARARQRAAALDRLIAVTNEMAESRGVDPPSIPMSHRDSAYLPTLQMEAVADFLEQFVGIDSDVNRKEDTTKKAK